MSHVPVLLSEVIQELEIAAGQTIVDGTLGGGGHTRRLAELVGAAGHVIAMDRDPQAIANAERELAGLPITLVEANFAELPEVLDQLQISNVDGVLLDLGLSSDQLADPLRGFSFNFDGPLDLRFNPSEGEPASRLVNKCRVDQLADIIFQFGEERHSRRIARAIERVRRSSPIRTAAELARIVSKAVPTSADARRIHPATRTFQALRIAVNDELKSVEIALRRIPDRLQPGNGRFGVISFHSLEDRIVKNGFREDPRLEVISRKPIRPTENEVQSNPRSRSARLRIARRV